MANASGSPSGPPSAQPVALTLPTHMPDASEPFAPLPLDRVMAQLTLRAALTGMVLGGLLSLCNLYSGLKIGWSNNMSVTAALLGFAFWRAMSAATGRPGLTILENNINQTAASAGAAISSAGLVAPIPALTMMTGEALSWPLLALWTFSVCTVGIAVAISLRRQMLITDRLPFPNGIAAATTLKEMYASGREAMVRVQTLIGAGLVAALVKVGEHAKVLGKVALPGTWVGGTATSNNLTLALEPNLLMIGVGGLIGLRGGISLLVGALLAYVVIAPIALTEGWASPGKPDVAWFGPLNKWLLWPGVTLMVTSSLTSFAFSWRSIARSFRRRADSGAEDDGSVSRAWFLRALVVSLVFSTVLQVLLFEINVFIAAFGVMMSFLIAVVAARVSGETNVTPVGAMGKITQLMFGALAPGQVSANLMAANVTGGAASQCADLMHDMKTGYLLGAMPRYQVLVQVLGALAGALLGSAAYLVLIPDPQTMLITPEWPAPAVSTWKAVAEIFAVGFDAMPPATPMAILVGGLLGIALAIAEKKLPGRTKRWVPSPSAIGLAFVLPAYNAISMFFGALVATVSQRLFPSWSARFIVVIAAGLIAGESLAGVGIAIQSMMD